MSAHDWREVTAMPVEVAGRFWCITASVRGLDAGARSPDPLEIEAHEVEGLPWDEWLVLAMQARDESEDEVIEWVNEKLTTAARRHAHANGGGL